MPSSLLTASSYTKGSYLIPDFSVAQTYQVSISLAQDGLIFLVPLCASDPSQTKKAAASFWLEKVILLQANPHFHSCPKAQSAPPSGQVHSQAGRQQDSLLCHISWLHWECVCPMTSAGWVSFPSNITSSVTQLLTHQKGTKLRKMLLTDWPQLPRGRDSKTHWRKKAIRGKCCPTTTLFF